MFFNGLYFSDDPDYAMRAYNLLAGHGHLYTDNNGLRIGTWSPAALGYLVFGINDFGLVVYPLMMAVVAIGVVARLGTRLFDRRTGVLAALLLAIYPLDVELATRLLPDALLAVFSLFTFALLLSADTTQADSPEELSLRRPWSYFFGGAALGWCMAINMSAAVLLAFVALYFPLSAWVLCRDTPRPHRGRRFVAVCCSRYLILAAGAFAVAVPEALLYRLQFGSYLVKYQATLSHYNNEGRSFFRDLWMYPENMFFIHRGWTFQLPPPEDRPMASTSSPRCPVSSGACGAAAHASG